MQPTASQEIYVIPAIQPGTITTVYKLTDEDLKRMTESTKTYAIEQREAAND
jgi:hypothetical protein